MDFSAANKELWNPMIQMGIISGLVLLANILRGIISASIECENEEAFDAKVMRSSRYRMKNMLKH